MNYKIRTSNNKSNIIMMILLMTIILYSCDKNEYNESTCGDKVIIDDERFTNDVSDPYRIVDAVISDKGCLLIVISAGGCDGENMSADIITNEVDGLLTSTRQLRLILDDNEDCEALIRKEFSFDLNELEENGSDVSISLEGYDGVLTIR